MATYRCLHVLLALTMPLASLPVGACSPVTVEHSIWPYLEDNPADTSVRIVGELIEGYGIDAFQPDYSVVSTPSKIAWALGNKLIVMSEWANSDSPWLRAAALLARHFPLEYQTQAKLPFAQLAAELRAPEPALRAAALLLIDINDPQGRASIELALGDGAWVQPVAATVADHAYLRLTEVLDTDSLLALRSKVEYRPHLNAFRGLAYASKARAPWVDRDPDWRAALGRSDGPVTDAVLAGLWHDADPVDLTEAMSNKNADVALTAFDAITERLGTMPASDAALVVAKSMSGVIQRACEIGVPSGLLAAEAALETSSDQEMVALLISIDDFLRESERINALTSKAFATVPAVAEPDESGMETLHTVIMSGTISAERIHKRSYAKLLKTYARLSQAGQPGLLDW